MLGGHDDLPQLRIIPANPACFCLSSEFIPWTLQSETGP